MSVYENRTEEKIKVEVEKTKPKIWKTVRPGEKIETESYGNYYMKEGLSLIGKGKKAETPKGDKGNEAQEKIQTPAERRAEARKARVAEKKKVEEEKKEEEKKKE